MKIQKMRRRQSMSKSFDIVCMNNKKVTIDPDKTYTIQYIDNRKSYREVNRAIGNVRCFANDNNVLVTSPYGEVVMPIKDIINIEEYYLQIKGKECGGFIGMETKETSIINHRILYDNGESNVTIKVGNIYRIKFVSSIEKDTKGITLKEVVGKIDTINKTTVASGAAYIEESEGLKFDYIINIIPYDDQRKMISFGSDILFINLSNVRYIEELPMPKYIDKSKTEKYLDEIYEMYLEEEKPNADLYTVESFTDFKETYHTIYRQMHNKDEELTQLMVDNLKEQLEEKVRALKLKEDEYALVDYANVTNTINCHGSVYPVTIELDENECTIVTCYTNFGAKRVFHTKPNPNIIWDDGVENVIQPREKNSVPISPLKTNVDLEIKGGLYNNIYLGHRKGDADNSNAILVKISNAEVKSVWFGGNNKDCVGNENRLILESCTIDDFHCGSDLSDEEEFFSEYVESNMEVIATNSTIKDVYMGGTNSVFTNRVTATFSMSTIDNIYCSGVNNTTNGCIVLINKSKVKNVEYGVAGSTIHSTNVTVISTSEIDTLWIGSSESNSVNFIETETDGDKEFDNKLNLDINPECNIKSLKLGYVNGAKLDPKYIKITTPDYKIGEDEDELISNYANKN